jgi:dihydroxyacetone kinase-like predicted kinase
LKRMNIEELEIITLYFGEGITLQIAEEAARRIKSRYSHLEIQVVNGGQAHYAYIISAE